MHRSTCHSRASSSTTHSTKAGASTTLERRCRQPTARTPRVCGGPPLPGWTPRTSQRTRAPSTSTTPAMYAPFLNLTACILSCLAMLSQALQVLVTPRDSTGPKVKPWCTASAKCPPYSVGYCAFYEILVIGKLYSRVQEALAVHIRRAQVRWQIADPKNAWIKCSPVVLCRLGKSGMTTCTPARTAPVLRRPARP